jgi:hypothetical protein
MRQHGSNVHEMKVKYTGVTARMFQFIDVIPDYDVVITPEPTIQIEFDYPIRTPVLFEFTHEGGFTVKDILLAVKDGYKRIYADAEKYDIWGHALDDLILEGVEAATPTLILLTVSPA